MLKYNLAHKDLLRQLDYDPLTGIFTRKVSTSPNVKIGDITGCDNGHGYIVIGINKKQYMAHLLAWFHYYGYWPENMIDHIDRVKHHNWITNLREVTNQCNQRNCGNHITNTSGVKGVHFETRSGKWIASIYIMNKRKNLGAKKDFDEAVCHRLAAEQCLDWSGCDNNSPAYQYVKENIQNVR